MRWRRHCAATTNCYAPQSKGTAVTCSRRSVMRVARRSGVRRMQLPRQSMRSVNSLAGLERNRRPTGSNGPAQRRDRRARWRLLWTGCEPRGTAVSNGPRRSSPRLRYNGVAVARSNVRTRGVVRFTRAQACGSRPTGARLAARRSGLSPNVSTAAIAPIDAEQPPASAHVAHWPRRGARRDRAAGRRARVGDARRYRRRW